MFWDNNIASEQMRLIIESENYIITCRFYII
jgi:hypothetical protein